MTRDPLKDLTPERWQQIQPILDQALELPAAERAAYLDEACGDDADLRTLVESLVAADEEEGGVLDRDSPMLLEDLVAQVAEDATLTGDRSDFEATSGRTLRDMLMQLHGSSESDVYDPSSSTTILFPGMEAHKEGSKVGHYRIVRRIGEGGMGVVYEAEQQDPRRRVAVKVLRGGAEANRKRIRMFRREAQALGRLDHTGIARVHEAGVTKGGEHFFAMELVEGPTLSEWLNERSAVESRAELEERLELFRGIVQPVSYAHQRGVIHRDIKPSNIVVAAEGVKVLDFGLARIVDGDMGKTTLRTSAAEIQGTLPYMSPEQVRGENDEIDVRSDVYSLGVLLYELLSCARPLDLKSKSLPEMARAICEQPPAPLDARAVDDDVRTIVAKALRKDPAERYQSAAALLEDIDRFLTNQPILARPPSSLYELRKLVQRHRGTFTLALASAVLVVGLALAAAFQSVTASRERDRANREAAASEQVSRFLIELFEKSDPNEADGGELTARDLLDQGKVRIEQELSDQPLVRARLLATMGASYRALGDFDSAEAEIREALRIRQELLPEGHPDIGESLTDVAGMHRVRHDYAKAAEIYEQALPILEAAYGPDDVRLGPAINGLAIAKRHLEQRDEAEALYERVLEIRERELGPMHPDVAETLGNLAVLVGVSGDRERARGLHERALAIREEYYGPNHPRVAASLHNLGTFLAKGDDDAAGEEMYRRAMEIREKTLGPNHPELGLSVTNLAINLNKQGRYRDSLPVIERALRIWRNSLGEGNPRYAWAVLQRGVSRMELGELEPALTDFETSLAVREHSFGPKHSSTAWTYWYIGELHRRAGRTDEAIRAHRRAYEIREERLPEDEDEFADSKEALEQLGAL
ncbi:hypothetical protein ABI59_12615 [Acidobacteria bacterium Mor1]|nr:hypothetical protein ABI59_12615 [Acidobacteria bacterium Mor1]